MPERMPTSAYFHLEALAPGVFAAISQKGTGAWSNAGIVDLGDCTLIFDTFATPAAAADLRRVAVALTGRTEIRYVVNSHCHGDHVYGNQVFSDATIIATHRTREMIIAQTGTPAEERQALEAGIRDRTERLQVEQDPAKRRGLAYGLAENQAVLAAVDAIRCVPPTLTFANHLTLHGSQRSAELVCPGVGHTEGDTYLYLPAESILFAGDLVTVRFHPFIGSSAAGLRTALDRLQALPPGRIVPGHGPLGTAADLDAMCAYLADMEQLTRDLLQRGVTDAAFREVPVLPAYADWGAANVSEWNLHLLADQIRGGHL